MNLKTSAVVANVGQSAISRMMAATAEMRKSGRNVIGLHVGEPDFDTPENIMEAASRAMREGQTHYTALAGTPELKAAIQTKFERDNSLKFADDEVMSAPGAKMLIFMAFLATLEAGDEVIIPAPYWTNYLDIVKMTSATPVIVPTRAEDGFRLRAEDLARAITSKTRWIMFNSPSNPSGAVYAAEHYNPLLDVVERHPQIWLIVDDMYEGIVFDGVSFSTPAQLRPALRNRILTISGVSKTYAMTGWRIGYAAGPGEILAPMLTILSQSTSCACSIAQAAAAEALAGPQDVVEEYRRAYQDRRDLVMTELGTIQGLTCAEPEGSFYAFVGWETFIGKQTPTGEILRCDEDLCSYLLQRMGVAVIPGAAFGSPGQFRISFAGPVSVLKEGMALLRDGLVTLN